MYRCSNCHSTDVQHAHWVNPNTEEVASPFGSWNQLDAVFCSNCEGHHPLYNDREQPVTAKVLNAAAPYTVFPGVDVSPYERARKVIPLPWGIFNVGAKYYSDESERQLELRSITVEGHIQRDDQVLTAYNEGVDNGPFTYDDVDAAIDALLAGITLVKVPDADGTGFRMYVVESVKPWPWNNSNQSKELRILYGSTNKPSKRYGGG